MAHTWSRDELNYLRTWAGKAPLAKISKQINVPYYEVLNRARAEELPQCKKSVKAIDPPSFNGEMAKQEVRRKVITILTDSEERARRKGQLWAALSPPGVW